MLMSDDIKGPLCLFVYIPAWQEASVDIISLTAPGGLTLSPSPTCFLSLYSHLLLPSPSFTAQQRSRAQ